MKSTVPKIFCNVFQKNPAYVSFKCETGCFFIKNYAVIVTTIDDFKEVQSYLDLLLEKHLHDSNKYYHQKKDKNYVDRRWSFGKLRNYKTVEANDSVIELRRKSAFFINEVERLAFTSPYMKYIQLHNRHSRKIEVHAEGIQNVQRLHKALHCWSKNLSIQIEKRITKKDRIRRFFEMWKQDARAYIREDAKMKKTEIFSILSKFESVPVEGARDVEGEIDQDEEEFQKEIDDLYSQTKMTRKIEKVVPNNTDELNEWYR